MPTLEELENDIWGPPEYDSYLIKTCHALQKKELNQFTFEDFRILIGQNDGLKYLLPRVLPKLLETPWAFGDFYDGDVLKNVLECQTIQAPQSELDHQYVEQVKVICAKAIECAEPEDPFFGCDPQDLGISQDKAEAMLLQEKNEMIDNMVYQQIMAFAKPSR